MKLEYKYLTCFSREKADSLIELGFSFLYEKDGVFYFENNKKLFETFSSEDILKDVKKTITINF